MVAIEGRRGGAVEGHLGRLHIAMMTRARLTAVLAAVLAMWAAPTFAASDDPADSADAAEQVADAGAPAEPTVSGEWAGPLDWAALGWHPGASFGSAPRDFSIPTLREGPATTWDRTENRDGSAAVTVKHSLTSGWESKIGADLNLAPARPMFGPVDPASLLPGATGNDPSAGAAWATLAAPTHAPVGLDGTALGARLESSQSQHKVGVSASKSLSLGERMSLTLQGGYAATDVSAIAPAPLPPSGAYSTRVYTTEEVAKLTILPTRTTIAAGRTLSSSDDRWLNNVSAEQQLFKDVTIAGSISESVGGPPTTSITAKFLRRW